MYNDTYKPGTYLDLTPSEPFAKNDTCKKMQMQMNGLWMMNTNLPLMKPGATWTWAQYNVEFKTMVVPVPTDGFVTRQKNVLILDTLEKVQLMRDHFPQWLIDSHCKISGPSASFKPIVPPELELPEPAQIDLIEQVNRLADAELANDNSINVLAEMDQPMIHESVEAPNGEMITLEYSTPSQRLKQIRKFENEGGLITHAHNEPCPMMGDELKDNDTK